MQVVCPDVPAFSGDVVRVEAMCDGVIEHPGERIPRREEQRGRVSVVSRELVDPRAQTGVPERVRAVEAWVCAAECDTCGVSERGVQLESLICAYRRACDG